MKFLVYNVIVFSFLLVVLSILITSCHDAIIPSKTKVDKAEGQIIMKDVIMPMDSAYYNYAGLHEPKIVFKFYKERNYSPAWFKSDSSSVLGDSMVNILNSARLYGLQPKDYHQFEIGQVKSNRIINNALVRLDVLFTDAFFTMANHLQNGRLLVTPSTTASDSTFVSMLHLGLGTGDLRKVLGMQEPDLAGYRSLKKALWQMLDSINNADQILLLSGIKIDSIEIQKKIQLIEINLERWRWDNKMERRYVWVNIPAYELRVIEEENVVMKSKVIVGTPERQTPILSSLIECFVIYPYWHVPRKIAVEELLPAIKLDTSYLLRNNFDVLDRQGNILDQSSIEWQMFTKDYFPVILRQREGSENSLGIIKFVFDNPYAVYLHDTNAKRLFNKKTRALSHGCIRIETAIALAHYLITGNINDTSRDFNKQLDLKKKHIVNLSYPIPIYTRYFTCDYKDNELLIYADIYKKDSGLIRAFYGKIPDL